MRLNEPVNRRAILTPSVGSDLANAVDEHLSAYLSRRADEAAKEADQIGKQVALT